MFGFTLSLLFVAGVAATYLFRDCLERLVRRRKATRGRVVTRSGGDKHGDKGLRLWGPFQVTVDDCREHFAAAGKSKSGKSYIQRRLMADVLTSIRPGSNRRCYIFDAKNEIIPFLMKIGVSCPVFSINPLESRTDMPISISWDCRTDITSIARAQNLAAKLVPSHNEGSGKYFTDAARLLVRGMCESFIRHNSDSCRGWTFTDLVYASTCPKRMVSVLERDEWGLEDLNGLMKDERTAYQVFTTLYSKMSLFRPVAGLWAHSAESLSLRDWVESDSILTFGSNATVSEAVNPVYGLLFQMLVEEVDEQVDSETRETWVWLDEVRICEPILQSGMLSTFAVKARSKGGILVIGFQDIEGFKLAAGDDKAAMEIIGQCGHQAILRLASHESAEWASRQIGQHETIESLVANAGEITSRSRSLSETYRLKDAMLPSEFMNFKKASPRTGIPGCFVAPERNPVVRAISPREFDRLVVSDREKEKHGIQRRSDVQQQMPRWSIRRIQELGLELDTTNGTKRRKTREPFRKQADVDKQIIFEAANREAQKFDQTLNIAF